MCLIVDANVASLVFPRVANGHMPQFVPLLRWLLKKDGRMVYGGKNGRELFIVRTAASAILELRRIGKAEEIPGVDEEQASRSFNDPEIQRKLAEQEAAFEGRRGAILAAVSAADGKQLAAYRLKSMPVFDGMAAAGGRLYLAASDGKVLCLGAGEGQPLPPATDVNLASRTATGE